MIAFTIVAAFARTPSMPRRCSSAPTLSSRRPLTMMIAASLAS